jgi:hypothetical protein
MPTVVETTALAAVPSCHLRLQYSSYPLSLQIIAAAMDFHQQIANNVLYSQRRLIAISSIPVSHPQIPSFILQLKFQGVILV